MMADDAVRTAVMRSVAGYHRPLALMLQATPEADSHREEARKYALTLLFEAFADRCYADDGRLRSRRLPDAVHTRERMLDQVRQILEHSTVTTHAGKSLALAIDSLCVHGDNPDGVNAIQEIRQLIAGGA